MIQCLIVIILTLLVKPIYTIAPMTHADAQKVIEALVHNKPLQIQHPPEDIDHFFKDIFLVVMSTNPQLLTYLALFESLGIREHNGYLNTVNPDTYLNDISAKKKALAALHTYNYHTLTAAQQINYDVLDWLLTNAVAGERFIFHDYKINQMFGILDDLNILLVEFHPFQQREDIEHYIMRLEKAPQQLEQAVVLLEHQKALGIMIPAFAMDHIIAYINKFCQEPINEHLFYVRCAHALTTLSHPEKDLYLEKVYTILHKELYPRYYKIRDYYLNIRKHYQANNGVWALPDGDAYYRFTLQNHTTTDMTPDEIYELGLSEVATIQQQMGSILKSLGYSVSEENIGATVYELSQEPQFYFPDTPAGKQECLQAFEKILQRCRTELYPLFDLKPHWPVMIQAVPAADEAGKPSAYYCPPSLDGSRPGIFFANMRSTKEVPIFGMETLAVHEAEPGHHFQISLQHELDIPIIRKLAEFNAYVEGWALYAEKLAYEQKFYSSAYAELGHLQDELLRAVRLVVDPGIHHKRWTREQAASYMQSTLGYDKARVMTEVERYFVLPGQACSYKIGQLKILELRARAKKVLDDAFDIKEFHNTVLLLGAAPLSVLEHVVDTYIHNKKRSLHV